MRPEYGPPDRLDADLERVAPELGLELDKDARQRLLMYLALIQRWTQVYNLTSVRNTGEMFTHHLLDCLAAVEPMRAKLKCTAPTLLDVGSGAGLPGVVLALLNPSWEVFCIDAVAKKAGFIRQVAAELTVANLHAVHGRVEDSSTLKGRRFDLVTSRAFASLNDFTKLTRPLLKPNGCWVAMKAHLSNEERRELPSDVDVFHVEQLSVPELDAARCLVWMKPAPSTSASAELPRQ